MKIIILIVHVFASVAVGINPSDHIKLPPVIVTSRADAVEKILQGDIWRRHDGTINYFEKAELWIIDENGAIKKEWLDYDFFQNMPNSYYKQILPALQEDDSEA